MRRISFIKVSILSILFGGLFICFTSRQTKSYVFNIKIVNYSKDKKYELLTISSSITNNSNDTLKYVNMSCMWDVIYSTNNKNAIVNSASPRGCDGNTIEILQIAPHCKSTKEIKVTIIHTTKDSLINFNVGIALIPPEDFDSFPLTRSYIASHKHFTLWSNTIKR